MTAERRGKGGTQLWGGTNSHTLSPLRDPSPKQAHSPCSPKPAGQRDNTPSLGEDAKHFKRADSGCLESKCCLNDHSLFSLGKGNRLRQKRPAEQVQPTATNFKAGAGFVMENTQQQSHHPCERCTNAIPAAEPNHTAKYTVTFFQFGCTFFPAQVRCSQYFFWHLCIDPRSSAEFQNSSIKLLTTLSVQSKGNRTCNIP